jgi:hypothetical protein
VFEGLFQLGSQTIIQQAIRETVTKKLYYKLKANNPDFEFSYDNLPAKDLSNLFAAADELSNVPPINLHDEFHWNAYQVSECKVTIIPEQVEKLKENYRYYANSPAELQKLAKVKLLCEYLNSFLTDPEVLADRIFTLVYFDQEAAKFAPSGAYVKFNLTPQIFFTH